MISVIIPTLNEENTIKGCLERLKNVEVIVVDGGSCDKTVEIAEKYVKVVKCGEGRGKQMNFGAKISKGDVLLFLHADTKLPENWISEVEETISNGYSGGVFKHSFGHDGKLLKFGSFLVNLNFSSFSFGDRGIFVKKDVFNKLNGYKVIPIMEDIEFVKRLKKFNIVYLKSKVITSARRFFEYGILKQLMLDGVLLSMYFIKVNPYKLSRFYREIR